VGRFFLIGSTPTVRGRGLWKGEGGVGRGANRVMLGGLVRLGRQELGGGVTEEENGEG